MQTTMAVEDFKRMLPELLDSLTPGDEVVLTRNHQTVARLVTRHRSHRRSRGLGRACAKG